MRIGALVPASTNHESTPAGQRLATRAIVVPEAARKPLPRRRTDRDSKLDRANERGRSVIGQRDWIVGQALTAAGQTHELVLMESQTKESNP